MNRTIKPPPFLFFHPIPLLVRVPPRATVPAHIHACCKGYHPRAHGDIHRYAICFLCIIYVFFIFTFHFLYKHDKSCYAVYNGYFGVLFKEVNRVKRAGHTSSGIWKQIGSCRSVHSIPAKAGAGRNGRFRAGAVRRMRALPARKGRRAARRASLLRIARAFRAPKTLT